MDWSTMVLASLVAVFASVVTHADALRSTANLRESFMKLKYDPPTTGPTAPASLAFVARYQRRVRTSLAVAIILTLAAVSGFGLGHPKTIEFGPGPANLVAIVVAGLSRCWVVPLLTAREARQPGGPRVARAEQLTLADYLPPWFLRAVPAAFFSLLVILTAVTVVARPQLAGLAIGLSVGLVLVAVAMLALASWLARQPLLAENDADLYWGERDLGDQVTLLLAGVFFSGMLFGVFAVDPAGTGSARLAPGVMGVLVVYLTLFGVVFALGYRAARRRFQRRWAGYDAAN